MWIFKTQGKRAKEYKDYVKVMLNELLLTINLYQWVMKQPQVIITH